MDEVSIHYLLTLAELALAPLTAALLLKVRAPYGRHYEAGWGPNVPSWIGWVLMECPATLLFAWVYFLGDFWRNRAPFLLFCIWQLHYVNRTFVFPLRLRSPDKPMPLAVLLSGVAFNCLNAYINGRHISHLHQYAEDWVFAPQVWVGLTIFFVGLSMNLKADNMLFHLRKGGETGYKIPRGWLFEYISCPNYFGEIIEWTGWAVASWSLPGLAFAVYSAGNLGCRALSHDQWYRATFSKYPSRRKALVPFLL